MMAEGQLRIPDQRGVFAELDLVKVLERERGSSVPFNFEAEGAVCWEVGKHFAGEDLPAAGEALSDAKLVPMSNGRVVCGV